MGKAAGAWRRQITQSSAEVKERVQLYLWVFVACSRVNFNFYLYGEIRHFFSIFHLFDNVLPKSALITRVQRGLPTDINPTSLGW
jgi:hypothetical protein